MLETAWSSLSVALLAYNALNAFIVVRDDEFYKFGCRKLFAREPCQHCKNKVINLKLIKIEFISSLENDIIEVRSSDDH